MGAGRLSDRVAGLFGDGLVKILDFGLAQRTPHASDVGSGITREGTVLGTVQYMSPEQAAARPHDHRSDQFSFGAILYEMATRRRAFERDTAPQTLAAIIEDEPESLRRSTPKFQPGSRRSWSGVWRRTRTGDTRRLRTW